jgi:uncharacterized protein with FMN-binding domain
MLNIPGNAADHPDSRGDHPMPTTAFLRSRPLVVGLAGLGLVGALAGCSATGSGTGTSSGASGSTTTDSGSTTSGSYKDGTYSADGTYQAPSGTEKIGVTLTIADSKVTKVEIEKHATDPNAVEYQTDFASGISAQVVGKSIDELNVARVAGSSLTSGGFRAAVDDIKKQAAES